MRPGRPQRFGEQRLLRSRPERWLYRLLGVADPAHYLHFRYLRAALRRRPAFRPSLILDAGCGAGDHAMYLARRFPDARVVGVDLDASLVAAAEKAARARGITNVAFAVRDVTTMTDPRGVDLVCAIDVLEHIPAQSTALENLLGAMNPGAAGLFHLPVRRNRPVPLSRLLTAFHQWARDEHLAEELTAESFVDRLRSAGYEVEAVTPTFGYWTGELATSLFNLPYRNTVANRALQGVLAPLCRALALADPWQLDRPRYAVAVEVRKPV